MSPASVARDEAAEWVEASRLASAVAAVTTEPGPTERDVTGFDPRLDLSRRGERWGFTFAGVDLSQLCLFAAGLAEAEAEAWDTNDPTVAYRAFEDRRFLAGDRIVHWSIPWADIAGRCHPSVRDQAHGLRERLLGLGDRLRVSPLLAAGNEGLVPPGEDSFGPMAITPSLEDHLMSLLSGTVIFRATLVSLRGEPVASRLIEPGWLRDEAFRRDLKSLFETTAARWRTLTVTHVGTARLWFDLAARAERTAAALG